MSKVMWVHPDAEKRFEAETKDISVVRTDTGTAVYIEGTDLKILTLRGCDSETAAKDLIAGIGWYTIDMEDDGTATIDPDGMTEEDIAAYCKKLSSEELDQVFVNNDFVFDENESTSRNIRNFAEKLYEETPRPAYTMIHVSEVYDDNNGYEYGIEFGGAYPDTRSFEDDRECRWFKEEEERDAFIKEELAGYTNLEDL